MTHEEYYQYVRRTEGAAQANRRSLPDYAAIKAETGLDFTIAGGRQNEIQPVFPSTFTPEAEALIASAAQRQGFAVDKERVRRSGPRGEYTETIAAGRGWRLRSPDIFPTTPEHIRLLMETT